MNTLSRLLRLALAAASISPPINPNIDPAPCVTAATRAAGQMCISHFAAGGIGAATGTATPKPP